MLAENISEKNNTFDKYKQSYSIAALTTHGTPSPTMYSPAHDLSQIKDNRIKDKIKQKFMRSNGQWKRNQSLGNVNLDINNLKNPQLTQEYLKHSINYQPLQKSSRHKQLLSSLSQSINKKSSKIPVQTSLPLIKPTKTLKKTNFLQVWLDQALDPQDAQISSQGEQKQDNSLLSTVKKYKIDKKYLKNQNIPTDTIERLYNTLYIYTHGVDHIFNQLLRFTKDKQTGQHTDKSILNSFWKSLMKLFEGCTSFRTCFQQIQQTHLQKINSLKQFIYEQQQKFANDKKQFQQIIQSKQKRILEMISNQNKLESDYKVNNATLDLTDFALNQEIQLRLRFQEKINHVYNSYEQLKGKYQFVLQNLKDTNSKTFQSHHNQLILKQKVKVLQCQLKEIRHLFNIEKEKVKQRETQIIIKNEELLSLEQYQQLKKQAQMEQSDAILNQINKKKLLSLKLQNLQQSYQLLESVKNDLQKRLSESTINIQSIRLLNQRLHQNYSLQGKQISLFQQQKLHSQTTISQLTSQLSLVKQANTTISTQLDHFKTQYEQTVTQLNQCKFTLKMKEELIISIQHNIQELKAVKDKHAKLYQILLTEKESIQKQRNHIQEVYNLEKEQIQGLKMLQQNRQKHIKQIQAKNDKQKQLFKRKISGLNETITKKQTLILTYQKQSQQSKSKLIDQKYRTQKLEQTLISTKSQVQRFKHQTTFLFSQIQQLQTRLNHNKMIIQSQSQQLKEKTKEHDIKHQQLISVKDVHQIFRDQQNLQNNNLYKVYKEYRDILNQKGMHIHPMVHQDVVMHFNRLKQQQIPKLQHNIKQLLQLNHSFQLQNVKLAQQISQKNNYIIQIEEKLQKSQTQIDQLKYQKAELKKQSILLAQTVILNERSINQLKKNISKIKVSNNQLTSQLNQLKAQTIKCIKSLQTKDQQIERLNISLNKNQQSFKKLKQDERFKQAKSQNNVTIMKLTKQLQQANQKLLKINNLQKDNHMKQDKHNQTDKNVQTENQINDQELKHKKITSIKFDRSKRFSRQYQQIVKKQDKQVQTQLQISENKRQPELDQVKVMQKIQQFQVQHPLPSLSSKQSNKITKNQEFKKTLKLTYLRR